MNRFQNGRFHIRCQFHHHTSKACFSRTEWEPFFWCTVFGKWQTNLSNKFANLRLKFGVIIVGDIEKGYFSPNAVRPRLFAWQNVSVKSTKGARVNHGSISLKFYEQEILKVQKRQSSCQSFFCFRDLRAQKLRVERWWNWHHVSISPMFYVQLLHL